ncbi:hypothetical protein T492DRAFT_16561 [Pavlovales sp. CCMP2436]|nr:hypothetical protein T492DRAFT_16561 [Pavlovales sp. CCMP2436]
MLSAVPARTSKRGAGGWKRVQRMQADGADAQKLLSPWRMAHALSRQAASAPAAEMDNATLRRRTRGSSQEVLHAKDGLAAGTVKRSSAPGGDSLQRSAAQPLSPLRARWSSSAPTTPASQAWLPVRRASLAPTMRVNPLDVVRKGPVGRYPAGSAHGGRPEHARCAAHQLRLRRRWFLLRRARARAGRARCR